MSRALALLAVVLCGAAGERDVVAVLRAEDAPLVRKVRRTMIAGANQHALEYYKVFTVILTTMTWRPDWVR